MHFANGDFSMRVNCKRVNWPPKSSSEWWISFKFQQEMWICWHLLCLMCRNSFQVVWRWILGSTSEFLWSLGLGALRGSAPLSNLTFGRATSAGLVMTCSIYHAGHRARILNSILTKTYFVQKDQKVKDVSTFADTWGFGSAFNGFRQVGGSSQTGAHRLRLSECLLQLGFALALELERDWGGGFGREHALRDLENVQALEVLWEDSHGGMCSFRGTFPGVWSSSPSTQPRTKRPWPHVRFHTQDYWKKWVFAYFPAECGIWSWCFLSVILILNLCFAHSAH